MFTLNDLIFLVLVHLGCPGKVAIKRVLMGSNKKCLTSSIKLTECKILCQLIINN